MKIARHRLLEDDGTSVAFERSPNSGGKVTAHEYLVLHFTAGGSAAASIRWLTNPAAKASAHLVIGRDGRVTQLVPFDTVSWHAGASTWLDRVGLNHYSIGIELDNAGELESVGGRWMSWFGKQIPDEEVLVAAHKHESRERGWHTFTESQLDAALEVATLLADRYELLDVLGHDDIAPGRKLDPGPAFPMRHFRSRIFGRADQAAAEHRTTTALNIRSGPGVHHPTLSGSPLPQGTRLRIFREEGSWRFVEVLEPVDGIMDLEGWVHGRYLAPV